jgi:hypothetical protein
LHAPCPLPVSRWESPFQNMVTQLTTHFKGQNAERILLFIDIFAVKQNEKGGKPMGGAMQRVFKVRG